ncbi:MAG: F0F1 ATP synthase subunit epsilon [Propionibacteriaceae bacterium]|nr:F0F1 ATP synthase subunit epsilon [Propionibacteriaceae bacterium]
MALDSSPLRVEVVSADGLIWEGDAESVIARTTEGDLGIMSHHEPFFGVLVPSAVEVLSTEGRREIIAVDGGFISVAENRVSLLNAYARLAGEIDQAAAEQQLNEAQLALEKGDVSTETMQKYHRASAQVRAAQKAAGRH